MPIADTSTVRRSWNAPGPKSGDDHSHENTGKEWSNAELTELGNMLVGGLSIKDVARVLGRDPGEVRDKVVEVGRACG